MQTIQGLIDAYLYPWSEWSSSVDNTYGVQMSYGYPYQATIFRDGIVVETKSFAKIGKALDWATTRVQVLREGERRGIR